VKIWIGQGSEHSSRLTLIGHFARVEDARLTAQRIEALAALANEQPEPDWEQPEEWFDETTRKTLEELRLWQIGPADLDIFRYEHSAARDDMRVKISTDEYEVQGFIKLMILAGARVEVYSRDDWTEEGSPVPREAADGGQESVDES
jgi:hypothetical protein